MSDTLFCPPIFSGYILAFFSGGYSTVVVSSMNASTTVLKAVADCVSVGSTSRQASHKSYRMKSRRGHRPHDGVRLSDIVNPFPNVCLFLPTNWTTVPDKRREGNRIKSLEPK